MDLSRRGFLGALAVGPLSQALAGQRLPTPVAGSAPRAHDTGCALPESRAGFRAALRGRAADGLLVFPGAVCWASSLAQEVRKGMLVIFESGAGFTDRTAFDEQRAALADAFDLRLEPPISLWQGGPRPSYVDLEWPARVRVRDFSFVVPVRGGHAVGSLDGRPVAALRRAGAGALLFLGSPVGPALGSGDPQAQAWWDAVLASTVGRASREGGCARG